jgi:2-iminobutanoate/2-iminopropanoate deaminase
MSSTTPRPLGPYSPIVRAGDFLIVSGQIGTKDGVLASGGLEPQVRAAMANLDALLTLHGARLRDVVKTTVFLTDMADFAVMNAVYAEIFGEAKPARSTVAVAGLPLGACFEIEAWAHRPVR